MGLFKKAKDKLGETVESHGGQIDQGIDKAAEVADEKTGGKFSDQIDTGVDKAKDALDNLEGKDDEPNN